MNIGLFIKKIHVKLKKAVNVWSIQNGLIKTKRLKVNNRIIEFHDINKSNLLKEIAMHGFESYENEVVLLIKNYPWPLSAVFDIGANIGFYSILFELYFPHQIKIVAVEPFPLNTQYIKKIKEQNKLNFELVEKAIDRESGKKTTFYFSIATSSSKLAASASLINSFQGTDGVFNQLPYSTIDVTTETLSQLIHPCNDSLLIKLDCEGNELAILKSSVSVLERNNVDFIVEIMINNKDKDEVFSLMKNYGYNGFLISNAGLVHEDRPLTFPYPDRKNRTIWKNHFFTKKSIPEVEKLSKKVYGYWI